MIQEICMRECELLIQYGAEEVFVCLKIHSIELDTQLSSNRV